MSLFPKSEIDQSIPSRFEMQVARHPDRLAVKDGNHELSYDLLNRQANRIAAALMEYNLEGGPVATLCDQGSSFQSATLGILKAGSFYAPVDPRSSPEMVQDFLDRLDPQAVVLDKNSFAWLDRLSNLGTPIIPLDALDDALSEENPNIPIDPNTLAYVYFTSGTTGNHKGVMDTHRNVLHNVMRYTNSLGIHSDDRLSLLHSPSLSACVSSQYGALLNGASVFPKRIVLEENLEALPDWLISEGITIYHSIPQLLRFALNEKTRQSQLRWIRLEGDQAQPEDLGIYQRLAPQDCRLVNGFGTSETGICRQYFFDKSSALPKELVPVGYGVEDMELFILDKNEATGVGEIAIQSEYLSLGYWKQERDTGKVFTSPSDTNHHRIWKSGDLGRMEKDGCLVLVGRKSKGTSHYSNQKAERSFSKPHTPLEKYLEASWSDLLKADRVYREHNFFELNGDSLTAMRLLNRIKDDFSIHLPVRDLFDNPTLEAFASLLEKRISEEQTGASGQIQG